MVAVSTEWSLAGTNPKVISAVALDLSGTA
jgi:hypothetical protein